MEEKLTGIVVSAIDYRENDKLINVFTLEKGIVTASLKGVKKAGAKMKFAAAPFCLAEFVFSRKNDKRTVIGASLTDSFYPIRENIYSLYCGGAILEFLKRFLKEEIVSPELFFSTVSALKDVAYGAENDLSVTTRFFINALKYSGYALNTSGCFSCGNDNFERVFFDYKSGAFYCEDCRDKDMKEINRITYSALQNAENGIAVSETEAKYALRLIDFYITNKTEENLKALKELNKLCAERN